MWLGVARSETRIIRKMSYWSCFLQVRACTEFSLCATVQTCSLIQSINTLFAPNSCAILSNWSWCSFIIHANLIRGQIKHILPHIIKSLGSTRPFECNWGATWKKNSGSGLETREYGRRDPSPWPRGTTFADKRRSQVSIVRSRTQNTEFVVWVCIIKFLSRRCLFLK
jgi:hypothetical protein